MKEKSMKNRFLYSVSISLFSLLIFAGCQNDPFSSNDASGQIQVRIVVPHLAGTLGKIESAGAVDRVYITVTAPDMDTVSQDLAVNNGRAQGEVEVQKGNDRKFALTGESQGIIIFEAVKEQDISQDKEVITLTIPLADFTAEPDSGLAPLTVRFQGNASSEGAGIAGWTWDFGDGGTSTEQNPTHMYEQYGIFTVKLEVQDSAGSRHTEIKERFVAAAQLPTAKFAAFPNSGEAPLEVRFKDYSLPGSTDITSWVYDFGDGSSSTGEPDPVHTYQNSGTYTVNVQVGTNIGTDTKTVTDYITVKDPGADPVVNFSVEPREVLVDQPVSFTDLSDPGSGVITGRVWRFGDGDSSTVQDPQHTYNTHGDYLASLTVFTSLGGATYLSTNDTIHVTKATFTKGDSVMTSLQYGDNTPEDWTIGERQDQMFLVRFTAEGYTSDSVQIGDWVDLVEVQMYLAGTQNFTLVILDGSFNVLGQKTVTASDPDGAWHSFNVEDLNLTLSGDFYIGLRYTGSRNVDDFWWPAIGFDTTPPSLERSYIYYSGTGEPQLIDFTRYGPGNLLFRAIIKAINQEIKET